MPVEKCTACNGTGKTEISVLAVLVAKSDKGQGALGKVVGLSPSAFSRLLKRGGCWWRSVNNSTYNRIGDLAAALGVTKGQLLGDEPLSVPRPLSPFRKPPAGAIARSRRHRAAVARKRRKKAKAGRH